MVSSSVSPVALTPVSHFSSSYTKVLSLTPDHPDLQAKFFTWSLLCASKMYHSYPNLSCLWRGAGVGADAPRKEWVLPGPCLQHCWPWLADAQRASALSLGSSTGCSYTCWRCPSCTVQETQELNVNWANSSTGPPALAKVQTWLCSPVMCARTLCQALQQRHQCLERQTALLSQRD